MPIKKTVSESTGIYRTESIGPFTHDMSAEDAEVLSRIFREGNDLDGMLSDWETWASEILKAHGLAFPAALFADDAKPVAKTAARLIADIAHLRKQLTPDVHEVVRQALRVGRGLEKMAVRPFEELIRGDKHLIERNGRTCFVTDDQHRMLCYLKDKPAREASIDDFVREVFGQVYKAESRDRYDQQRFRLNKKLLDARVNLSIDISGDIITLTYF